MRPVFQLAGEHCICGAPRQPRDDLAFFAPPFGSRSCDIAGMNSKPTGLTPIGTLIIREGFGRDYDILKKEPESIAANF